MSGFVSQKNGRAGCGGTGNWSEPLCSLQIGVNGHLTNMHKYLTGEYIGWSQALLVVHGDGSSGYKLKYRKIHLNMGKHIFTVKG